MYFSSRDTQNIPLDEYVVHSGTSVPTSKKGIVTVERPKTGIYEFDEEQPPAAVGSTASADDNVNADGKSKFSRIIMFAIIVVAIGSFITVGVVMYINNDGNTNNSKYPNI